MMIFLGSLPLDICIYRIVAAQQCLIPERSTWWIAAPAMITGFSALNGISRLIYRTESGSTAGLYPDLLCIPEILSLLPAVVCLFGMSISTGQTSTFSNIKWLFDRISQVSGAVWSIFFVQGLVIPIMSIFTENLFLSLVMQLDLRLIMNRISIGRGDSSYKIVCSWPRVAKTYPAFFFLFLAYQIRHYERPTAHT